MIFGRKKTAIESSVEKAKEESNKEAQVLLLEKDHEIKELKMALAASQREKEQEVNSLTEINRLQKEISDRVQALLADKTLETEAESLKREEDIPKHHQRGDDMPMEGGCRLSGGRLGEGI